MPQTTTLVAKGLYTFPDLLGEIPQGSLTQADNVVIDRDGVVTPRRGFATYGGSFGSSDDTAKQLLYYKARLLRHWDTTLDFDSDGAGTFLPLANNILEQSQGVKIKFAEMNGNLYFTSSKGIKKISATAAANVLSNGVSFAGGVEALDGQGFLNTIQGWFTQDSQVAYRIVWGIEDSNTNVVLGTPSQRIIVTNSELSLLINNFNNLLIALDLVASAAPVVLTGDSHANNVIDGLSSTANLSVGMTVADTTDPTNIPSGTTIQEIVSSTNILISNNATTSNVGDTYSFGQTLSFTDFSALELPTTASSTELYSALQALALQLDTSLDEHIYNGLSGPITNITPSVNVTTTGNSNFTNVVTNIPTTQNIVDGMTVSGNGVLTGTTVTNVTTTFPIANTGTVTAGSTVISSIPNTSGIVVGMTVTGDGILAGTTVQNIPIPVTGNSNSNTTIDMLSSTAALSIGMAVFDDTNPSNIPSGTVIDSIIGPTSITISQAATGTFVADNFSFGADVNTIAISQEAFASNTGVALSFTNNTITVSAPLTSNAANISFLFSSPTVITSASNGLISGDEITLSGTNSNPVIDTITPVVVTVINANQFSIPTQTSIAGNTGEWQQYPASIALAIAPDLVGLTNPATTQQLTFLQEFFDNLIDALNLDENISAEAKQLINGEFANSTQSATTNVIFTVPSQVTEPPNGSPTINLTGTLTASSQIITGLSSTANLIVGTSVVDLTNPSFIPTGTTIINIINSTSVTLSNPVTTASTDALSFLASTAWFYQVYRSDMATSIGQGLLSDQTADDELRLIAEATPTAAQLTSGYINFFDNVPESFRLNGANLYTNQISGAGILQENSMPPYSQDLCLWTNFLFFANTSEKHELQINLLTTTGLLGNTFTTIWNNITTNYIFAETVQQFTTITVPVGNSFPSSGPADYFDIFNAGNFTTYRFYFQSGSAVPPSSTDVTLVPVPISVALTAPQVATALQYAFVAAGQDFGTLLSGDTITIENLNPGFTNTPNDQVTAPGFTIVVSVPGSGEDASTQTVGVTIGSTPAQGIDATARSLIRIMNHNPRGGIEATYLSGPTDLPGQILFEVIETSLIPVYFTASASIDNNFSPMLPPTGTLTTSPLAVVSDNNAHPNRLYWSTTQQPDAVPLVNFQDIGQRDYPILRIMPLRDSLFILKEDGVFRLYGNTPSNFTVYLFDSSTKLLAQETACVLNNQVYMFTNQGVVTASDTGVSIISRPIENNLVPINVFPDFTSTSFGVSYEADRAYMLWCQAAATDTQPTICYRYNTLTTTWVDWPITKTCGVVIPDTNIMYLGAGDVNFVEKERKTYTRLDQADRQYDQTIPPAGVNGAVLNLGSVFEAQPGDAIVQTQFLTLGDYNRLINKLDTDPGTSISYTPYLGIPGSDLGSQLILLAIGLDSDPNLMGGYSAAISGFPDTFMANQEAFNVIVNLLNIDPGTRFHNYTLSIGTAEWEDLVAAINTVKNTITLKYALPYIAGPITIYKAISSNIQWAPQHCGDPSMLKHFSEGTLMVQNMSFDSAIMSYASDLNTGPVPTPFSGEGADTWGGVAWGSTTWGGDGTSRPFRTYIPVPIQKCRFIQPSFDHDNAFRTYSIFGVSYTWQPISSRGYR